MPAARPPHEIVASFGEARSNGLPFSAALVCPEEFPALLLKLFVLYVPWPKRSPTAPKWVAGDRYDSEAERARCLALVEEMTARPLDGTWPMHSTFGKVSGVEYSRLQAKHLDHHLRQFSA